MNNYTPFKSRNLPRLFTNRQGTENWYTSQVKQNVLFNTVNTEDVPQKQEDGSEPESVHALSSASWNFRVP